MSALCAGVLLAACADDHDSAAGAAERARQMRDVSRMLDAMEAPPDAGGAVAKVPSSPRPLRAADTVPQPSAMAPRATRTVVAGVVALSGLIACGWLWQRRRQRKAAQRSGPAISLAAHFTPTTPADPAPPQEPTIASSPTPEWTYKRTAFETPTLQLTLEPVDLLPRPRPGAMRDALSIIERLHAPGVAATLYLTGQREHPGIRHVGNDPGDFTAWEAIVRDCLTAAGEDGQLARWLFPGLLCQRARYLAAGEATRLVDEAVAFCRATLDAVLPHEQPWWRAQLLRTELSRLAHHSGATRLLSLRELGSDTTAHEPPVLDAWIDIHLAWATWLVGTAAKARLGIADQACTRLAESEPVWGSRRRAEVAMQRAAAARGEARLAELEHALILLDAAKGDGGDPSVLLLIADCAHQRAALLPPDEAPEACSFALAHAFAASQHPAWHIAALEMRLAIQLTHDALPGASPSGDIVARLRRELADARSLIRTGSP